MCEVLSFESESRMRAENGLANSAVATSTQTP